MMCDKIPLLDDLMSDDECAAELGRNARTLKRWRDLRQGPPYLRIGRQIYYRRQAVRDWFRRSEQPA